jgi:hypothetical protein
MLIAAYASSDRIAHARIMPEFALRRDRVTQP